MTILGISFALSALLAWGFGDFFIQKATKKTGIIGSLFYICLLSTLVLPIFIREELKNIFKLSEADWILIIITGLVAFFAGLFYFESLKIGKIAAVEPVLGLELPITIGLSIIFLGERLSSSQWPLIVAILIGIALVITRRAEILHYHKRILERGVIFAGVGAIAMGTMNFLVGFASQNLSPLFTIWIIHLIILILTGVYVLIIGGYRELWNDFQKYPRVIIAESVLDNIAWISFAYATTLIPISITTAISESYIALAVLLGLILNRERVKRHQLIGAVLAICGVIALSLTTSI